MNSKVHISTLHHFYIVPPQKLIGFREIQTAELEIIRSVQSRYFGKEIALLSKQKKLEVNNRIFKLDPYVDAQGVLRVGGRI